MTNKERVKSRSVPKSAADKFVIFLSSHFSEKLTSLSNENAPELCLTNSLAHLSILATHSLAFNLTASKESEFYKGEQNQSSMPIKYSFGKCKTGATYSARLLQKGMLDLEKIKKKYTVILEIPILIVINVEGIEINVHEHGQIQFKKCKDVELMREIAEKIYQAGMN